MFKQSLVHVSSLQQSLQIMLESMNRFDFKDLERMSVTYQLAFGIIFALLDPTEIKKVSTKRIPFLIWNLILR